MNTIITVSLFLVSVSSKTTHTVNSNNKNPEGRFFGYSYTSTEIIPKMITSLLPSSCVQVEPSLPPCRNVRNLDEFPRFLGGRIYQEEQDFPVQKGYQEVLPTIHTTSLGWGEYLGIYYPTVTVTAIELQTTTVLDSRTVVTFSVKGCKPSRLPLDLNLCPPSPSILEAGIKPTATIGHLDTTTVVHNALDSTASDINNMHSDDLGLIQPTEQIIVVNTENQGETQTLSSRKREV